MEDRLATLAVLGDPTRRRVYLHVLGADRAVSRDEAAAALGTSRKLAAFHLEKLLDAGLLRASYQRLTGRSGPGAGRPAKLYRASEALDHSLAGADLVATLAELGYSPEVRDGIVLRRCPFEALVAEHGRAVCEVNLALLERVHERSGERALRPQLDPAPGRCCVLFVPD